MHIPGDWAERRYDEKNTVVMNVWNKHVFAYDRAVADIPFVAKSNKHHDYKLASLHVLEDSPVPYEDMRPFGWADSAVAIQENEPGVVCTTDPINKTTFK